MDADREHVSIEDAQLDASADKLSQTYAGEFTEEEVSDAIHDAAEELQDAPLQMFVPLLAENRARSELQERKDEREHPE